MRRRSIAFVVWIAASGVCEADPGDTEPHVFREPSGRVVIRPIYKAPIPRPLRAPPLRVEPPGRFMPPPVERSSPLGRDQNLGYAPLSHGFHLFVPLGGAPLPPLFRLDRAYEVGKALGACWAPPLQRSWTMITLRLSFKRDGTLNGEPRIPFTDAGSAQQNVDLAHSLLAALKRCTPLPFSPSLGSAIAGEIFAISFTHQDQR